MVCAALVISLFICPIARADTTDLKFSFTPGPLKPGWIQVAPSDLYTKDRGYGFEPVSKVGGEGPYYFSAAVPEGNYLVTVALGDYTSAATTTVKAELRRLMLERIHTDPGQIATESFTVSVRRPEIPGGKRVRLKAPRETTSESWAWDDKLTLEFAGEAPAVRSVEITSADALPTIFIIGDSTSTDQSLEPFNSWGQMITRWFTPDVVIANHGESGETTSSFIGENRWAKVLSVIRPGDYVLMQFGHNDEKDKGPNAGAFKNYTQNLIRFVTEARAHGATPVIITPVARRKFDDTGKSVETHGDYPAAARKVARDMNVPLIDLSAAAQTLYNALGPEKAVALFATPAEATHHSDYGSYEIAKLVIEGIKQTNLPIAKDIVSDYTGFDPAHPDSLEDFKVPPEPRRGPTTKPLGS